MAREAEGKRLRRRANIAVLLTVLFVALFAGAFIGLVTLLDNYADSMEADSDGQIAVGAEAPSEAFYVLLIGSDSRKGTALYTGKASDHAQLDQYSDIMTLMRVDPQTYTVTLVTVPRDTVLEGESSKINGELRTNDPEQVVDAVHDLTGIRPDYYMMTTFISFENLINAIGGIDIDVPQTITVPDPATGKNVTVKAGKNRHLNGAEALVLARARKEYGGDQEALRQVNVRNIERTMIRQVLRMDGDADVEHVLAALEADTRTDVDLSAAGLLMLQFMEHASDVTIYDCTGPYSGEIREDGLWVVEGDRESWEQLMAIVDAGEDPSQVGKAPSF